MDTQTRINKIRSDALAGKPVDPHEYANLKSQLTAEQTLAQLEAETAAYLAEQQRIADEQRASEQHEQRIAALLDHARNA